MTMTSPVDDPRTPKRRRRGASAGTVEEQLVGAIHEGFGGLSDTVLKGFDTVMQSSNAALKEVAEAKRDLQQTLDMVIRAKADAVALAGGMGGIAPPAARTPVALAVQELQEAKEIRHRAAQATDENYRTQARDPATGRFVKRQAEAEATQGQREDRFDAADKRVEDVTKQREEQNKARQEQLDRHDIEREQRAAEAGAVSPASQGRRRRLDYDVDPLARTPTGEFRTLTRQTREGIRESVYRAAASRAERYTDPSAVFASDLASRQVEQIRPGLIADPGSGNFLDEEGNIVSAHEAMQPVGSQTSFTRKALTAQMGLRSLNAWRGGAPIGRSLAAALPGGVLKAAGGIGVAIGAANTVWEGVQSQHEQNRRFQEVYGGGNLEQLDDRASQWFNRNIRGRFSLLGGGNYNALFEQAMGLGLRGGERGDYIDEGAQIMGQGVGREQTGQIMSIAVEAGQSLRGLSDAIKSVNEAAKEAGVSAARARDIFIKNYQASSNLLFGGTGSQRMAASVTAATVGMARQYQDANLMGAYEGDMRQRMLASRMGVSYTEYTGMNLESGGTTGMIASEEEDQASAPRIA